MYLNCKKLSRVDADRPLRLRTLDGRNLGPIPFTYDTTFQINYTQLSEISFSVPRMTDGFLNPLYDAVTGYKVVYTDSLGIYILQTPKRDGDGMSEIKTVTGYSLEYMFSWKTLFLEEGTYNFWDPVNPSETVLGRVLELDPSWSPGYVAPRLIGCYRTFDQYDSSALDFCYGDAMEKYRCAIVFDVYNKTISAYDAGEDTGSLPIYLSFDNLLSTVGVEEIDEELVTKLYPYGSDGMSIRAVNPTGTDYLIDLSYFLHNGDLDVVIDGKKLSDRIRAWELEVEENQPYYSAVMASRFSASALKLSLEADLTDLKGELDTLTAKQSIIVQAYSLEKDDAGRAKRQEELDRVNEDIARKKREIEGKQLEIDGVQKDMDDFESEAAAILERVGFETFFTESERAALCPYLIEGELSEDTFVASDLDTDVSGVSSSIEGTVTVTKSKLTSVYLEQIKKTVLTIEDGRLSVPSQEIDGEIVRGTLDLKDSGAYVLTITLGRVEYGDRVFPRGMLTVHGEVSDFHWDVTHGQEDRAELDRGTWFDFETSGSKSYFSVEMTEFQQYSETMELYDFGREYLRDAAWPTYEFSVDSANFLYHKEFEPFRDALELGKSVHLNLNADGVLDAKLIGFTLDMEDISSFSLVFSNRYKLRNQLESLQDEVASASRATRSFDASKYIYNRTADKTTQVGQYLEDLKKGAAEAVLASKNQSVVVGGTGIHIGGESKYQLRLTDSMIAMTDDSWKTAKVGIGRFASKETGEVFGVNAELLAGDLMIGKSLVLQNPLLDENNHPTGTMMFKVDSTGAWLYNSRIVLQNENGVIAIDPDYGIVAGTKLLFDTNGTTVTPEFMDSVGDLSFDGDGMPENANFFLDGKTGDAYFRGKLLAKSGKIGGFTIENDYLHAGSGKNYAAINGSGTNSNALYAFWAGGENPSTAPFWVKKNGDISVKNGDFSGTLRAAKISGNLTAAEDGGWLVGCGINVGDGNFYVDPAGNLTMKGNINLSNGSITWGNNGPVKYQFSTSISGPWHNTMSSDDKYRRDSLDGGKTWGTPYQFVGEDGRPGYNGSDADVTRYNIARAMLDHIRNDGLYAEYINGELCLLINASAIKAGEITGINIRGGSFYNTNGTARLVIGNSHHGDMTLYSEEGTAVFTVFDNSGSTVFSSYGSSFMSVNSYGSVGAYGDWDFSTATVTGLHATFA